MVIPGATVIQESRVRGFPGNPKLQKTGNQYAKKLIQISPNNSKWVVFNDSINIINYQ